MAGKAMISLSRGGLLPNAELAGSVQLWE